jgi:hypothetical protein
VSRGSGASDRRMADVPLLNEVIAAHGGAERWAGVRELKLQLRIGGKMLALKFQSPRPRTLSCVIDARRVHAVLEPFPGTGLRGVFETEGVRIETREGDVIAQRRIIRDADGHAPRRIIWDDLDLLYFLGYAVWNYAVTPYLFLWPGFECREGDNWYDLDSTCWRTLHVRYPPGFPTHSREQVYYFDEQGLLRRLDYTAYAFSEFARGAHFCDAHRVFDGLIFPTRRVVFPRRASGRPVRIVSVMEGWLDNVSVGS